jgi:DNA-directed RNA polymerase subunit beta'
MKNIQDLKKFESLKIFIASGEDILNWSYGEVTKPETINYRTFKPERFGLFDERIFGPHKDYECACGKYKRIRYKGVICDKCGVEVTKSSSRRERMGHISLATPVAHVWFFKANPSKLATLLDLSPRNLESVIYFSSFIVTGIDGSKRASAITKIEKDLISEKELLKQEMDLKIKDLELTKGAELQSKKGISAEEALNKLQSQIQKIRNSYQEKESDIESTYKMYIKKVESVDLHTIIADTEYTALISYLPMFAKLSIGAEGIKQILETLDLNKLALELKEELESAKEQKAIKILKRLRVVEGFRRSGVTPSRMIMDIIPVIPCDLRPIVPIEGGRAFSSDLNDLYRRVINRNNRLRRLMDLGAPEIILRNEKRMLQEAVDALFDSSKQRVSSKAARGPLAAKKQLKSLADLLKGKSGRFRGNLLGKRVDYSGRSVIVNGPDLNIDECGIPREMALELFRPMVLREIMSRGLAPNERTAKHVLESRVGEVYDILEEVVKGHPVLLNRAPTLWRLGIQAFYPKLIDGNAIRLHLCVASGYNADFDGDTMSVHVPISAPAIDEAKRLMISTNNLLKPSDGTPVANPAKEMIWGSYYLTKIDESLAEYDKVFSNFDEVKYVFNSTSTLNLRQKVKVRHNGEIIITTPGRIIFNEIVPSEDFKNKTYNKSAINSEILEAFKNLDNKALGRFIDDLKNIGLKYGTKSGQSASVVDISTPDTSEQIIDEAKAKIEELNKALRRGLATPQNVKSRADEIWYDVKNRIQADLWESLGPTNPVRELIESGSSKATKDSITQIAGLKGQIVDTTGKTVDYPILGNYKNGYSGFDYFLSSKSARKGLADRALKTADSGYLTRRLVDVAQDVIIREEDCGVIEGYNVEVTDKGYSLDFIKRIEGRFAAKDIKSGNKLIVKAGESLTKSIIEEIKNADIKEIIIRSPLFCETKRGVCQKCFGTDLMTQELVKIGTPIGVASAQSIGEPGTQLTMRTFWGGGVAGGTDITLGLERVEEIFEARVPKAQAIMSEIEGKVKIMETGDDRKVVIVPKNKSEDEEVEYVIDITMKLAVEDGQSVQKGDKITDGHKDLTELQRLVGVAGTKKYIVDDVIKVYSSQGVALNDKYVEVIVKQMFNHVRVEDSGDTTLMVGETVTRSVFDEENEKVIASGGRPAIANVILLGIKRAAIGSDSFLSAASFEQTSLVLTDAAASGKVDSLLGLKENVILGRLIPVGDYVKRI